MTHDQEEMMKDSTESTGCDNVKAMPILRTVPNAPLLISELVAMQKDETFANGNITVPLHLLDNLSVIVLAMDMETFEIIYSNGYAKKIFGDIHGKKCWCTIQKGQVGPCSFCSNRELLDNRESVPSPRPRELQNTLTQRWYSITETATREKNGRLIKIQVAEDITKERRYGKRALGSPCGREGSQLAPNNVVVMCCNCHKIKDDQGKWIHPATYIHHNFGPLISHGLCTPCARKLYPASDIAKSQKGLEVHDFTGQDKHHILE